MDTKNLQKVTLYWQSPEWGGAIHKCEAKLVEHGTRRYAQYDAAPYARFIPKRKRKLRELVCFGRDPYLLILDGWDRPEPPSMYGPAKVSGGCIVQEGRHSMVGGPWKEEMDELLLEHGIGQTHDGIVADYRCTYSDKKYR
jgi:hypothetical protein